MLRTPRPDYLVLRPAEAAAADSGEDPWLRRDYLPVREFHVPEDHVQQMLFAGRNIDLSFTVYKLRPVNIESRIPSPERLAR
jgi:hypothetical protein